MVVELTHLPQAHQEISHLLLSLCHLSLQILDCLINAPLYLLLWYTNTCCPCYTVLPCYSSSSLSTCLCHSLSYPPLDLCLSHTPNCRSLLLLLLR
jgi:hypothetical protein